MKGFLQGPCPDTGRTGKPFFFQYWKKERQCPSRAGKRAFLPVFRHTGLQALRQVFEEKMKAVKAFAKPSIKTRHLGAACFFLLPSSSRIFRSGQPDGFNDFLPFFRFLPDEPGHGRHPVRSPIPQAALPCGRFFHGGIGRNGFLFSGRNRIMSAKKPDCSGFFEATVFLMLSK